MASRDAAREHDDVLEILRRDLAAARYKAQRAWKQYDAADPENRLVVDELERRWNHALEHVHALEQRLEEHTSQQPQRPLATVEDFQALAAELEALWHAPEADIRLKKRIVRTLIQEVVVDVDTQAGEILLSIHWKGGVHTELRLPRRRRGHNRQHTSQDIVEAVRMLVRICTDDVIAGVLNRNGLLTGHGNRWTRERVASLGLSQGGIGVYLTITGLQEEFSNTLSGDGRPGEARGTMGGQEGTRSQSASPGLPHAWTP